MISFQRTQDRELIKSIVTDAAVYPHISDDFSPEPEKWEPIDPQRAWYVLVSAGEKVLGLWILIPRTQVCWEVHTCLLPCAYGAPAHEAVKELSTWVWQNLPALRVTTEVPEYNRLAYRFAKSAGMREYGRNPKAWMHNGELHDVILLGISKPGVN